MYSFPNDIGRCCSGWLDIFKNTNCLTLWVKQCIVSRKQAMGTYHWIGNACMFVCNIRGRRQTATAVIDITFYNHPECICVYFQWFFGLLTKHFCISIHTLEKAMSPHASFLSSSQNDFYILCLVVSVNLTGSWKIVTGWQRRLPDGRNYLHIFPFHCVHWSNWWFTAVLSVPEYPYICNDMHAHIFLSPSCMSVANNNYLFLPCPNLADCGKLYWARKGNNRQYSLTSLFSLEALLSVRIASRITQY